MRDIPPEALIQKPHQVANLLSLLQPADVDSPLPQAVLALLLDLATCLKASCQLARDPELLPHPHHDAPSAGASSCMACFGNIPLLSLLLPVFPRTLLVCALCVCVSVCE
jgi:hypothetical protein